MQGLDPDLLAAVAAQETGGPGANAGRNILGDGGHGHGVFQIDDRWHSFARGSQALNPQANAEYAAHLLRSNLDRYGGDLHKALSAYNAGSSTAIGTKTTWNDGKTLGYADSVMRHYEQLTRSDDRQTVADVGQKTIPPSLPMTNMFDPASVPPSPPPPTQAKDGSAPGTPPNDQSVDYSSVIDPDAA